MTDKPVYMSDEEYAAWQDYWRDCDDGWTYDPDEDYIEGRM